MASLTLIAILVVLSCPNLFAQRGTSRAPRTVFTNPAAIAINTTPSNFTVPSTATLYPSPITVSGMTGNTTRVAVTLDSLTYLRLADLDLLLVSPTGQKYVFMSDALPGQSSIATEDKLYTFADDAAGTFPTNFEAPSGSYKPLSGDTVADVFPAPAPAGPYGQPNAATFASVFNGASPNGVWSLYAVDDSANGVGSLNSGWSLSITTDGSPATNFSNSDYIGLNDLLATSSPYGSSIIVSGQNGVISNLKVTINGFSHPAPSDVDILLVGPNGTSAIIMSDVGGATSGSVNLTFDDNAPSIGNVFTITSGTYGPANNFNESLSDTFPSPAPFRPYGQPSLGNFNGTSPNGEWRLFVVDDQNGNSGTISGGWSLDLTTTPTPPATPLTCSAPSFTPTNYGVGAGPTNMAIGDFNNDGKQDIAVSNQISNNVSVLIGNGNGTFASQSTYAVGSGPYSIVAGNFNADTNLDLAVANSTSNNVSILIGNGSGSFTAGGTFLAGANPISIASGDFNNDSKADLAIANFGGFFVGLVTVLLGNGSGAFTAGPSVRTRSQPSFVAVSNFNGDGFQDLVVANFGAGSVSTYFGNGTGSFQLQQNITSANGPVALRVADFGTDGINDLVIANYNSDTLMFCTGTASGGFVGCNPTSAGGNNPISIAAADFVGGGSKTTAVALSGSNLVKVLNSNVTVGDIPNAVETADFNGDGKADIASVNLGSNDVSVLLNQCKAARGNIFDYNGDRRTDFSVYRGSGSSYFIESLNSSGPARNFGRPTDQLVPADYNGDLKADYAFFRPSNGLWYVSDASTRTVYFTLFGLPGDVPVPNDFDGDGKADIAVFRPSAGLWYIRRSTDNAIIVVTFGSNGDIAAPADYDGDGKTDVAVFRPSTGVWYIAKSSDGGFIITQFGSAGDVTVSADYDSDGKADIALWRPSTGVWYVLRSSDGGFSANAWGSTGDFPVVGDFEGDGTFDFAVWRPTDRVWYVRKSSDGGGIFFQWGVSTDIPIPNAFVR